VPIFAVVEIVRTSEMELFATRELPLQFLGTALALPGEGCH
jgi:hypothetical protein